MATAPAEQLRHALAQAHALLGLSRTQQPPTGKPSLAAILLARLDAYHALASAQPPQEPDVPAQGGPSTSASDLDERDLQHRTSLAALALLERTASLLPSLAASPAPSPAPSTSSARPHTGARATAPPPPLFGIGDAKALAQLAAVVGRWGIRNEPAPARAHAKRGRAVEEPRIVELGPDDEADKAAARIRREDVVRRVVRGVLGVDRDVQVGAMAPGAKQFLGTVLPQLLGALVGALVDLGEDGGGDEGKWAREALDRIFKLTPTPTVLSTLLALVAATRPASASRTRLSALLSAQLLHPAGLRSLFVVVVGVGSAAGGGGDDEVSVSKLEMVRRVVETAPVGGDDEAYYANITSQLLDLLRSAASSSLAASLAQYAPGTGKGKSRLAPQPAAPPLSVVPAPIIRAAAWCVAHLVVAPPPTRSGRTASQRLLAALHAPLLPASASAPSPSPGGALGGRPLATHLALVSLLALYAPPLPSLLSTLIAPLVPPLLALVAFLDAPRLVAPLDDAGDARALEHVVRDEASALLGTWAKSAPAQEAVRGVARAVERCEAGEEFAIDARAGERAHEGGGGAAAGHSSSWRWAWGADGTPELVAERGSSEEEDGGGEGDEVQLRVDAPWLVGWIAGLERKELAAGLFLRWLDEVKVLRGVEGVEGARRTVTRLQLVLQMVEHLGSDILADPREIIAFVAHALDAQVGEPGADAGGVAEREEERKEEEPRGGLAGLRIVEEDQGGPDPLEGAEQDEDELELGLGTGFGKDEMAMTALTLLLAVLEADDKLDMNNTPLLAVIYTQLDTLQASTTSALIPPLAREARMVLSLRRASSAFAASSSSTSTTTADGKPDPLAASRDTYRSALKLLQDPLLPVRAQGLHLLRSLVLDKEHALLSTDPALLPAVLDIFVAALEEEDSFLYLNAVQGLSSLVDVFGRQVVGRLLEVYTGRRRDEPGGPRDVGEGERGMRELDKRLRVGETLTQVIQRAGEALAVLIDDILPSLLVVLRSSNLPIPLRASAITILAACVETAPTALVQHADALTEACVTLLQVESVPLAPRARAAAAAPLEQQARRDKGKEKQSRPAVLIEEVGDSSSASSSAASSDDDDEPFSAQAQQDQDDVPPRPEELVDPTTSSSKHPTLRRAAAVFLGALVRTVAHQAAEAAERREHAASAGYDERDPFGLGAGGIRMPFSPAVRAGSGDFLLRARPSQSEREASLLGTDQLMRARTVLRYVSETDEDALVREQTRQVLSELEG
ncbi:hypothetical protein JCM9279_007240 [Rhodotorula babjevae]